ncbi:MAG: leucine-rich repeat domain-containing protein [Clostridia bacterium]|nr:leucine-rich repeat domain-containing protein [Clostridia bacterium]
MKKYFILLGAIAVLALAAIICLCISSDSFGRAGFADVNKFKVVFVKDGQAILTELAERDKTVSPPDENEIPDGKFITWCVNGKPYDFSTPINCETVLTAVYNRRYTLTFTADGKEIYVFEYTYLNRGSVTEPEIPEKQGYLGAWEGYVLDGGNKTTNAVYTPINYKILFMLGGTDVQEVTCTVEDYKDKIPQVPTKQGHEGVWKYTLTGVNEVMAEPFYTPLAYSINFFAEGKFIKSLSAVYGDVDISAPEIPEKEHYSAVWEEIILADEAVINVNAVYTPKIYRAVFRADGSLVKETKYTILDSALEEPEVPQKTHYVGRWQKYELPYTDFYITAEYVPIEYKITFTADGNEVAILPYTVETDIKSLPLPQVPQKAGYRGEWEAFTLSGGDLIVSAKYSVIDGTAGLVYLKSGAGYIVTKYNGTQNEVIIPSFYNGLPVTGIGENAFMNCTVEKVTICENVETLGNGAFLRCGKLKSIELPISLVSIGEYAFYTCSSLLEITVPDKVETISKQAFSGCSSLVNINIGASVRYIGVWAFEACDKLETANFKSDKGWTSDGNFNYGAAISVSPIEAARVLKQYCDYTYIRT